MTNSVLTIVAGRGEHLHRQAVGLSRCDPAPDRWIVVGMNEDVAVPKLRREYAFKVQTDRVDDPDHLPLAAGRNRAAAFAERLDPDGSLMFLDVDCIPAPTMIGDFAGSISREQRLWMGSVRYLPAGVPGSLDDWGNDQLANAAIEHPLQPIVNGPEQSSERYELFWSLCFAIPASLFVAGGGFDESYRGYGGEDTDFAFRMRSAGVPFGFSAATAYHQHHPVCKPPLQHFEAILRNAQTFRDRWGVWPMGAWLDQFAAMGLIDFDPSADRLVEKRVPTSKEIAESRVTTAAGF